MISLRIPGFADLCLEHLVLDFNGTLAEDGTLLAGVRTVLAALAGDLTIHVVTADTFGRAAEELDGLPVRLTVLPGDDQADAKLSYVQALGTDRVVAVGNGRNDRKMLAAAALGIAVVQREGGASDTLAAADVVVTGVLDALELLRHPTRLVATLRS
jgi:soluble P-type ATPase